LQPLNFLRIERQTAVELDVDVNRFRNVLLHEVPRADGKLHSAVKKVKDNCAQNDQRGQTDDVFHRIVPGGQAGHQDAGSAHGGQRQHRQIRLQKRECDQKDAEAGQKRNQRCSRIAAKAQNVQEQG